MQPTAVSEIPGEKIVTDSIPPAHNAMSPDISASKTGKPEETIIVENLDVRYPIFDEQATSIKSTLQSLFSARDRKRETLFHRALKDVSFSISAGERVCFVGRNGAGKTTLLKSLTGILPPNSGRIRIKGHVSSLLDFTTGFDLEQSGYDNIYLRGLLLGFTKEEILSQRDQIIEFAALGEFINRPIKTYSAGMFLRLAFAITTTVEPDILIADEIIAAGDVQFAEKAQKRLYELINRGNTVVIATHSIQLAEMFCSRAIWLEEGRVMEDGDVRSVFGAYEKFAHDLATRQFSVK